MRLFCHFVAIQSLIYIKLLFCLTLGDVFVDLYQTKKCSNEWEVPKEEYINGLCKVIKVPVNALL
jgi:hypothetical protein